MAPLELAEKDYPICLQDRTDETPLNRGGHVTREQLDGFVVRYGDQIAGALEESDQAVFPSLIDSIRQRLNPAGASDRLINDERVSDVGALRRVVAGILQASHSQLSAKGYNLVRNTILHDASKVVLQEAIDPSGSDGGNTPDGPDSPDTPAAPRREQPELPEANIERPPMAVAATHALRETQPIVNEDIGKGDQFGREFLNAAHAHLSEAWERLFAEPHATTPEDELALGVLEATGGHGDYKYAMFHWNGGKVIGGSFIVQAQGVSSIQRNIKCALPHQEGITPRTVDGEFKTDFTNRYEELPKGMSVIAKKAGELNTGKKTAQAMVCEYFPVAESVALGFLESNDLPEDIDQSEATIALTFLEGVARSYKIDDEGKLQAHQPQKDYVNIAVSTWKTIAKELNENGIRTRAVHTVRPPRGSGGIDVEAERAAIDEKISALEVAQRQIAESVDAQVAPVYSNVHHALDILGKVPAEMQDNAFSEMMENLNEASANLLQILSDEAESDLPESTINITIMTAVTAVPELIKTANGIVETVNSNNEQSQKIAAMLDHLGHQRDILIGVGNMLSDVRSELAAFDEVGAQLTALEAANEAE